MKKAHSAAALETVLDRFGARMLFCAVLLVAGCSSTPPPAPVPAARQTAISHAEIAAKLTRAENWKAAVREWQLAADHFALLNDPVNEAVAWHNLGLAQMELNERTRALASLERAAAMNRAANRTHEWWRNQIALLQLESAQGNTNALAARLGTLSPSQAPPPVRALFLNELGQYQGIKGEVAGAEISLREAERLFQQTNDLSGVAAVAANRATLWTRDKQFAGALQEWRRARTLYEFLAEPLGIARTLEGEGRALFLEGRDLPAAEPLLRQAARNYATLRRLADQKRAIEALRRCLSAQGKPME